MSNAQNLKSWQPGQSGNALGKPKGTKHLSTHIQELLNDENFTIDNFIVSGQQFKGAPIRAIITVGIVSAIQGDYRWAEWLTKHGYNDTINGPGEGTCFSCSSDKDKKRYGI